MPDYKAKLKTRDNFDERTLVHIIYNWLTSPYNSNGRENKNCFKNLYFPLESETIEDNKELYYSKDPCMITYIYKEELLHTDFVITFELDEAMHLLTLSLTKKIYEDSTLLDSVKLPRVFEVLMDPKYILNDHDLRMNKIYYGNDAYYKKLSSSSYQYPLVILRTRDRHYPFDPKVLLKDLMGIAHVICLKNQSELLDEVEVIFPDGTGKLYHEFHPLENDIRHYMDI